MIVINNKDTNHSFIVLGLDFSGMIIILHHQLALQTIGWTVINI